MRFKASTFIAIIIASGTCVNFYLQVRLYHTSPFYEENLFPANLYNYQDSTNPGGGCSEAPGSAQQWNQVGNSIYGNESSNRAVKSVSISSDGHVVAVAKTDHTNGNHPGKVCIHAWNGAHWEQLGSDLLGERGTAFGHSISLSSNGTTVAIGGSGFNIGGNTSVYVRVYSYDGSDWNEVGAGIEGYTYDYYGQWLSLSSDGNKIAVAAPGRIIREVCVRVFYWNGTAWVQRGKDLEGELPYDNLGKSVALSSNGRRVVIGNTGSILGDGVGRVSIYQWNGSDWNKLGSDITNIGYSVSISCDGKTIASAMPSTGDDYVRVYAWDGTTWNQLGSSIIGLAPGYFMGKTFSLSCDGRTIASGSLNNGVVRIFKWDEEVWSQVGTDVGVDTAYEESDYMVSLSADGTKVIIAAQHYSGIAIDVGAARIFSICT